MKKIIFNILLCGIMILGLAGCGKDDLQEAKEDLEKTYEKYGYVEKENVNLTVARFNTEIMESNLNTPATDDSMVVDNNLYWYALTDDISYYLKPIDFSNDIEKDITDMSALYFDKEKYNEEDAQKYARLLIKANNVELTDSEIDELLKDAKEKQELKQTANNGKGISVGIVESDDHFEYQVIRLYK